MENLVIRPVDRGTELARDLNLFVEHFSWEEVREHTLRVLRNWEFTDWETMFVAMLDGKIVGMASLLKTDFYPLPEIYPWISSLFVSEEYRGNRISGRLIEFAAARAAELGFEKTYIPTEFEGLYEKYGYRYVGDIVNYAGGKDRLYAKRITKVVY